MSRLATPAPTGDHRVVRAFAFIDLCGFTDYVDRYGDEAAVAELRSLRATVRDVAPRHGVRVDKWLGDGVMLVSVDSDRIVGAVVTIEQRYRSEGQLPLRAGVAAGPVILLEGDDYIGNAVNIAARLCDDASAGNILAATEGLDIPEGVHVGDPALVEVRGIVTPVTVATLTADAGPHPTAAALQSLVDGLTRPVRLLRAGRASPARDDASGDS